jgi:mono/diheme cytochrome c family protein
MKHLTLILAAVFLVTLTGCRGKQSAKSPIHISPNMDRQEKFIGQQKNPLFENSMSMRAPVAGTIARGFLRDDTRFYTGREESGDLVSQAPIAFTREVLERGQERYDIYCAVCHGEAGDGKGIIMVGNGGQGYGFVPAPDFHTDRLRELPDGHYFEIISNGTPAGTMPGYGQQIPIADRWAILGYIRALQRSQNAAPGDVPENELQRISQ